MILYRNDIVQMKCNGSHQRMCFWFCVLEAHQINTNDVERVSLVSHNRQTEMFRLIPRQYAAGVWHHFCSLVKIPHNDWDVSIRVVGRPSCSSFLSVLLQGTPFAKFVRSEVISVAVLIFRQTTPCSPGRMSSSEISFRWIAAASSMEKTVFPLSFPEEPGPLKFVSVYIRNALLDKPYRWGTHRKAWIHYWYCFGRSGTGEGGKASELICKLFLATKK